MIFDITSHKTSKKFLVEFLDIDIRQINEFIEMTTDFIYVDEFLEYIDVNLEEKNIDDLLLTVLHLTSNDDACETIKEAGLLNLKHALTMDTTLSRYLRTYNISFDISNNLMCINDKFHELNHDALLWEVESQKGKLNDIARKIYSYNQINGYFSVRDLKRDCEDIHLRPEIINAMSKLAKNSVEFENKWIAASKSYLVKFALPLDHFAYNSFYETIDTFKLDYSNRLELKKYLVDKAITVIWNYYYYGECSSKIEACLKPEVSVSAKYINEIVPL